MYFKLSTVYQQVVDSFFIARLKINGYIPNHIL